MSARELEEAETFQRFRKKHEEFFGRDDGLKVSLKVIRMKFYRVKLNVPRKV